MKKGLLILLCLPLIGFASFPIKTNNSVQVSNNKCDILILQNEDEISIRIMEITPNKISKCNNEDRQLISISKKDVLMIKYRDGTNEINKSSKPDYSPFQWVIAILLGILGFMILMALYQIIMY